jgi:hypothetical protein
LCLLPSPLAGPSVWQLAAAALRTLGWDVAEGTRSANPPDTTQDVLAWFLAAIPGDQDVLLVPHSNAGLYVPMLTAYRSVTGYIFVDAGLPGPAGLVPTLPVEMYDFVAGMAGEDGRLPPWTEWWDPGDVSALFPSVAVRRAVEDEQPRLPLTYFRESLPVPSGWDDRPGAYLAFGDTYAAERALAKARGWPVRTLPGGHLHMLIDPAQVADEIAALAGRLAG